MRVCLLMLLLAPAYAAAQPLAKRPLTHADYDIWRNISGMTLSPDGRFIAYTLTVPKSDSTFIIREISTGKEWSFSKGGSAAPAEANEEEKQKKEYEPDDQPRFGGAMGGGGGGGTIGGGPVFSPDSKVLFFVLSPTQAEMDKAKAERKPASEQPRPVLAVFDLATGTIRERIGGIRSFRVVGKDAGYLILVKESRPQEKTDPKPEVAPQPRAGKPDQEPKPQEQKKDEEPGSGGRARTGSTHVIRNLADGSEVTFPDVVEYSVTKDTTQIVYSVSSRNSEKNGLYVAPLLDPEAAEALKLGKGRYYRMTWNEPQTQLLFFFDDSPPPPPSTNPPQSEPGAGGPGRPQGRRFGGGGGRGTPEAPPVAAAPNTKPRVFLWKRSQAGQPVEEAVNIIHPDTPGLRKGWQVVDRGLLDFSADGQRININAAPIPEPPAEPKKPSTPAAPAADRVELDLWHWKDEVIQPMQRVRGDVSRNRSFSAVYLIDEQRIVHLSDEDFTVSPPAFGDWAVANSDKQYRALTWENPTPRDYTLINARSGEKRPLLAGVQYGLVPSPKGNFLAGFDGKHWFVMTVPDGVRTVLTGELSTAFHNEDSDTPQLPGSYGLVGWANDEQSIYVADRFDIWKLAVDGSTSENVTRIGRSEGIRFRLIRVEKPEDDDEAERDRGLNAKFPWLLSATNLRNQDRGFYRLEAGQPPRKLVLGPRGYGTPVKAKNADTMILPISTFAEFGDYYATNPEFSEFKRLTDANPHCKDFNWAKAELIHYTSIDGDKLSGILVKPENFDPNKKYPMIIYIYERLSQGLHSYREPNVTRGQTINPIWYASNGYLVLMPDIAYKVGYPGQSALHCVLPAIQAVVDRGCVDENAIGINGQSWGGYQIAYMITRTNRFKAASAGAAVTNMTSAYNGIRWGTGMARQFQYERTQSRIGETLWQAPMKYIENSPVFMADRVQTPLLMINNDQDDAVPWYQGIEFYLSLRRLGKEVYMLNYNGERHNLARQANARDFAMRMHQFFEHHLKGEPMPEWMERGVPFTERDSEKQKWKELFEPKKAEQAAGKE